jgi:alpha-ketoglutarate-dependent taurine dioxygenase
MERPLVWKQACGQSSMLIGSTANDIVGLTEGDGRALLDELLEWSTQERFTYRHKWSAGDLVIFNNPALLHRSYPYSDGAGRVMHRTTLKGHERFEGPGELEPVTPPAEPPHSRPFEQEGTLDVGR